MNSNRVGIQQQKPFNRPTAHIHTQKNAAMTTRCTIVENMALEGAIREVPTSAYVGPLLLLFSLFLLLRLCRIFFSKRKAHITSLPLVPNGRWLVGHLSMLQMSGNFEAGQRKVFSEHANEDGLVTFWLQNKPGMSVLLGRHVRLVLLATSMRKPVSYLRRHGAKFLGKKTMLHLNGNEWKYYRSVVHKAFTPAALSSYQRSIELVCEKLVTSLRRAVASSSCCDESLDSESVTVTDITSSTDDHETSLCWGGDDESGSSITSDESADSAELSEPSLDFGCLITEVLPLMKLATIDIFADTSFGSDLGCCSSLKLTSIARAFDWLQQDYSNRIRQLLRPSCFFYWIPTPNNLAHKGKRGIIRSYIRETIAKRRQELEEVNDEQKETINSATKETKNCGKTKETSNVLTHLVNAVKENPYDGDTSSPDEGLADVLMTLLFAGYDTTSITLTYALYLLSQDEQAKERCLAEIDSVLDDSGRNPDGSSSDGSVLDLDRLQFTKAVVLETTRLYPAAPMTSRTTDRPLQLDGHAIPKETQIIVPIWSIHRDERNFPYPDRFLPCRWVESRPSKDGIGVQWVDRTGSTTTTCASSDCSPDNIPPADLDAFCPFSGGGRSCPGRNMAVQEAVTVLTYLLKNFTFDALDRYRLQPQQSSFIQKPHDNLPMRIRLRR